MYDADSGLVKALDFREVAPLAATEKMYLDDTGGVIDNLSTHGALAVGVPGTVAGLYELWTKHGSRTWEELVTLAASIASEGFVVDESMVWGDYFFLKTLSKVRNYEAF